MNNTVTNAIVVVPPAPPAVTDRTQNGIDIVLGLVVAMLTWWNSHQHRAIKELKGARTGQPR